MVGYNKFYSRDFEIIGNDLFLSTVEIKDLKHEVMGNKKAERKFLSAYRGLFQIRTGVNGFADRRLATRPRDPLFISFCECKGTTFFRTYQIFFYFIRILLHQYPHF